MGFVILGVLSEDHVHDGIREDTGESNRVYNNYLALQDTPKLPVLAEVGAGHLEFDPRFLPRGPSYVPFPSRSVVLGLDRGFHVHNPPTDDGLKVEIPILHWRRQLACGGSGFHDWDFKDRRENNMTDDAVKKEYWTRRQERRQFPRRHIWISAHNPLAPEGQLLIKRTTVQLNMVA